MGIEIVQTLQCISEGWFTPFLNSPSLKTTRDCLHVLFNCCRGTGAELMKGQRLPCSYQEWCIKCSISPVTLRKVTCKKMRMKLRNKWSGAGELSKKQHFNCISAIYTSIIWPRRILSFRRKLSENIIWSNFSCNNRKSFYFVEGKTWLVSRKELTYWQSET
jgi:hypothetical protein